MFRISLLVDTDEHGAVRARDLAKACLQSEFGEVRSITVAEWLHQQQSKHPTMLGPAVPWPEHSDGRYFS